MLSNENSLIVIIVVLEVDLNLMVFIKLIVLDGVLLEEIIVIIMIINIMNLINCFLEKKLLGLMSL